MGSSISFTLDTREFEAAMREYMSASRKSEADVINRTAGDVAFRAAEYTAKSTPDKIWKDMWKSYRGRPSIYQLINSQWKSSSGKGFSGQKMADLKLKFYYLRKASIAFLRSGWKECAVDFGKKYRERQDDHRNYGSRLGKGVIALKGINPTAFLFYFIPSKQAAGKNGSVILSIAQDALQKAINFKVGDMRQYLEKKMAQRARQFSAR